MIDEIEGIIVMVSDQQKALEFYTQKLGFEKKVDNDVAEYRWVVVGPKNSNTVISLVNPTLVKEWPPKIIQLAKLRIGTTGIWFHTRDIDIAYRELKSRQVEITPPKKQVWGGVLSSIYDQDKNILGLVGDSKDYLMDESSDSQKSVMLPNYITDPFMKKIKDDKDKEERIDIIKKLILELKEEDYAKFISYGIADMMMQLQKFHKGKSRTIKDAPGPIFSYDDRYFLDCKHTKEELYHLQEQILLIIKKGSSDIFQDVKRNTSGINDKEINVCLSQSFHYGLIERKRDMHDDGCKFFRYFTQ